MKYGLLLTCVVIAPLCLGAGEWSDPAKPGESVEMGRRAFQRRSQMPWYDAQQDGLRRLEVSPPEDDANRLSRWAKGDTPVKPESVRDWSWLWAFLRGLAWTVLGVLVALIIWGLIWAAMRGVGERAESRATAAGVEQAAARLEDLPLPVARHVTDLLAAARAYREAGDLDTAIVYLFAYQLVELDKHHLIQVTQGKTNRQYLGELRAHPRLVELVRPCMLACEEVYFGHHPLPQPRFEVCWENLEHFHQQLEQLAT